MSLKAQKFILVLGLVLIPFALASAYDLEEYYPLGEGNSWTYAVTEEEEVNEEKIEISGKETVNDTEAVKMMYSEDDYECIAFDNEGLKEYKKFENGEYEIHNPPKLLLPNVEIEGVKEYSVTSILYGKNGEVAGEGSDTGRIQLKSIEPVEVPGGKFSECLKFSSKREWKESREGYGNNECETWLAPGVGKVKEICINSEYGTKEKKEKSFIEITELVSALVNGRKIGSQE